MRRAILVVTLLAATVLFLLVLRAPLPKPLTHVASSVQTSGVVGHEHYEAPSSADDAEPRPEEVALLPPIPETPPPLPRALPQPVESVHPEPSPAKPAVPKPTPAEVASPKPAPTKPAPAKSAPAKPDRAKPAARIPTPAEVASPEPSPAKPSPAKPVPAKPVPPESVPAVAAPAVEPSVPAATRVLKDTESLRQADRDNSESRDMVRELEGLFRRQDSSRQVETPRPQPERTDDQLVNDLRRLFGAAVAPPAPTPAKAQRDGPATPSAAMASPTPTPPPRTVAEWTAQKEQLHSRLDPKESERITAVFRLEPQNAERFKVIAAQYRMDILLANRARGDYSIIPHGKNFLDKQHYRDDGAHLRERYGLSLTGLGFAWLEKLRDRLVQTQLISSASIDVSLLIPKPQARIILGGIVAGCRALGHELEDLRACYGTFVERSLNDGSVYEYVVTRLVLKDGTEVDRSAPAKA